MKKISRKITFKLRLLCLAAICLFTGNTLSAQASAGFTASSVSVCLGDTVDFTNLSTGAISYIWLENGSLFANTTNPSRSFSATGTYLISLVATDGVGIDTANTLILVTPALSSSATGTDASCFGFADGAVDLSPSGGTPNLSICFDGINDYVDADDVTTSNFSGGITVEAWVKPSLTWTTNDGMVVAFNTVPGGNHFLLSYNRNLQRFLYFDNVVGNQQQTGNSPLGQWAHLVLTITSSNLATMYVNGVVVKTFTTGTSWNPTGGRCSIGQEYDGTSTTSQHFNGCMDEVRIWNTALTSTTVLSNYQSCVSVPPTHPNINSLIAYYNLNEGSGTFTFDRSGNNNHGDFNGISWGLPADNNYGCFSEGTGYAYNWNNGSTTEDLSGIGAGTYMVTVTDGAGCTSTSTQVVVEPPQIVYSVATSPTDTICQGDSVSITSSNAAYTYTYSPSAILTNTSGLSTMAFPSSSAAVQIIAEDSNNCFDTSSVQITVNALPSAMVSGMDTICAGDSTTLTASGGTSYNWTSGDMTPATTVSPASSQPYTVTVTDSNGCSDDTSLTVVVNALPVIAFSGDSSLCLGDTTTITASGGGSYAWSTSDTTADITVSPTADMTYTLVVTDVNACQSSDSIVVTVHALPIAAISGDSVICAGDTASLLASGGGFYLWNTSEVSAGIGVAPLASTTYSVAVTDSNICSSNASFMVLVNPAPVVSVMGADTLCEGDSTILIASGAPTWQWNTGETIAMVTVMPVTTTNYNVTGSDTNGCSSTVVVEVVVNAAPVVMVNSESICEGDTATLVATGADTYFWDLGSSGPSVVVTPSTTTSYIVTGTDTAGCSAMATSTVTVNPLPAAPAIGQIGNVLSVPATFATYQWFLNGTAISGATMDSYVASQSGIYTVMVADSNGCGVTSAEYSFVFTGIGDLSFNSSLEVYPNPNQGQFSVRAELENGMELQLRVYNLVGQEMYQFTEKASRGTWLHGIDLKAFSKGVYLLELDNGAEKLHRKVIVE